MWAAIKYVGSVFTLLAFLFALVAWLYKARLLRRERLIKSVPDAERAELVERTLVLFKVDTSRLNPDQQYRLALKQVREQAKKFRITAIVIVIIAVIAAVLTIVAMLKVSTTPTSPSTPTPTPTSTPTPAPTATPTQGSLSGEVEEVEIVPSQGGDTQLFIHLSIKNTGSPTGVYQYAIHINSVRSKSVEYNGPFEEINGRYTIPQAGGKSPVVIQPQDSIIRKTLEVIGKDRKVDGWLMLALPLPDGVLRQAGIRYTVSFSDANGKNYEALYEVQ